MAEKLQKGCQNVSYRNTNMLDKVEISTKVHDKDLELPNLSTFIEGDSYGVELELSDRDYNFHGNKLQIKIKDKLVLDAD